MRRLFSRSFWGTGRRWLLGASLAAATAFFAVGIIFWGGFNTVIEATNSMGFCITCHEMRNTVFVEYKDTIHYRNRTGVRATCADCHVPDPWVHKMIRKVQASNEVFHKLAGTVDTPEKFEAQRRVMAERVWATMKATDSRECRNCHTFDAMNPDVQKRRAAVQHGDATKSGETCIDCHKGIAHKPVHNVPDKNAEPESFDLSMAPAPRRSIQ